MPNYWLVSARWGNRDMLARFLRPGPPENYTYWQLDPAIEKKCPHFRALRSKMRHGDRIAVKHHLGGGQVEVQALGIVKRLARTSTCVYVDWLKGVPVKTVLGSGCQDPIEGPYPSHTWLTSIFAI